MYTFFEWVDDVKKKLSQVKYCLIENTVILIGI